MRVHSLWCSSPDPVGQTMRTVLFGLLAYFLLCPLFYAAAFSYAHMPTFLPSLTPHHSLSPKKQKNTIKTSGFLASLLEEYLETAWVILAVSSLSLYLDRLFNMPADMHTYPITPATTFRPSEPPP